MFALCVWWDARPIDPSMAQRVARSLETGQRRTAHVHQLGAGLFAATLGPSRLVAMTGGRWLLFNGFIQNRSELRAGLTAEAGEDAALYAAARDAWEIAADRRVVGEYAAIVIDPSRRTVAMTRAAIQAPPMHWHRSGELLVAGSTARPVFATGVLRPAVDEQKIADSLYLNHDEGDRSWFSGITRVAIGHHVRHDPGDAKASRHYDPASIAPVRLKSDGDYVEAASALLTQGTQAALEGRRNPALALSGGLDSQAVATHAIPLLAPGQSLLALTGVPEPDWDGIDRPGTVGDERGPVAALAARYPALRTETIAAAGRSFDYRLGDMFLHAGGPPRNALNLHWLHDLHARAAAGGCDVLLTGAMGNATLSFDGDGAAATWLANGRWGRLVREVARMRRNGSLVRAIAREAAMPHLPALRRWHARRTLPDWCPMTAAYARAMRVVARARPDGPARSTLAARLAMLRGAAGEAGDLNQAMEVIHGVPMRDPTAYRPLVEFCLAIPDEQFWQGGVRRKLARGLLRGRVDDATIDNPRVGAQCADWHVRLTRQHGALAAELDRLRERTAMKHRFDIDRLADAVAAWPEQTPIGAEQDLLQLALPRALTTARFIQWVEQSNT